MKNTRKIISGLCVLFMPAVASAQTTGDSWFARTVDFDAEHSQQFDMSGEFVDAQARDAFGDNAPGSVAFICMNSEMMVAISIEGVDIRDASKLWDRPKLRNTQATLYIDGERTKPKGYSWAKARKMLLPQAKSDRAKIYNAVLRGQDVSLQFSRLREKLPLHLPPSDDTFRSFGRECGLGIQGKGVRDKA